MTFPLKRLVAASAVLVLAGGAAQAAQKITMDYTVGESVTAFAAKEAGFFAKHGLDVELVQMTQNSNAPAALQSGSLQVGMIQVANLLQAADGGLDFVAIAGASDNERGKSRFSVVVRTGLPVSGAKDLVGRKVGVPGIGASIDTFFRNWLLDNGVQPAQVNIAETTFLVMADDLKAGTFDAVTPLEPFVTRIIDAKIGFELVNLVDRLPHPTLNALLFVTTRDWAEKNRDTVQALRAAIAEADDLIRADPDKARAYINQYTKMPLPILASLPVPSVDAELRQEDFDFWAGMMQRLHMLQQKPDTARLIFP
jgi:NitT/TauT family transport system substrate-binding protein